MPAGGSGVEGGFSPADLQSAYKLPSSRNGSGQTVAVVYFNDDPNAEADLETYRSHYGLPACTRASGCFKKVNESGEEGSYPLATRSGGTEISLDLDMVSATCPNCHIILIEANEENLLSAISKAHRFGATVISDSWTYTREFPRETEDDRDLQAAGVPITFPTYESTREGATTYPAASPYVIAVGGTVLERAANERGWSESTWENTVAACSRYEPKPLWQTDGGCRTRMYADVSAVAVGLSIYDSYMSPGWEKMNGTSASSPIVAGTLALANEATRQRGAGAFYDDPSGVFDVVEGRNHGSCEPTYFCAAGSRYDGPTGLGTPDGAPQVTAPTEPVSSSIWAVRDATDDQYLYYAGAEGALTQSKWTPLTGWTSEPIGGTVATGSIPTAVRDPSSNSQWVYYVDRATNRIAYSTWSAREGWRNTVLGGTEAAAGSSPTVARDATTGIQYVYYVSRAGAITSWTLEARGSWVTSTLGGSAAANTSPTVIRDPATGFQNVFYIDARERSLAAFGGTPPGPGSANMVFGGRVAAANSSPAAVMNTTTRAEQVYYVASETTIAVWSTSSSGWINNNVGGSAAANTSPSVVLDVPTTITNVFYVDSRERALAAFGGTPPGSWSNQIFGGTAALGTSPVGIRDSSTGANWLWYTDSATGDRAYWAWSFAAGWSGFVL